MSFRVFRGTTISLKFTNPKLYLNHTENAKRLQKTVSFSTTRRPFMYLWMPSWMRYSATPRTSTALQQRQPFRWSFDIQTSSTSKRFLWGTILPVYASNTLPSNRHLRLSKKVPIFNSTI
eukprot:PhF_6_TR651/c0_g1_i3/m.935